MRRLVCWLFHRDYRYSEQGATFHWWWRFCVVNLRPPIRCYRCEGEPPMTDQRDRERCRERRSNLLEKGPRCVREAGHDGEHRDIDAMEWGYERPPADPPASERIVGVVVTAVDADDNIVCTHCRAPLWDAATGDPVPPADPPATPPAERLASTYAGFRAGFDPERVKRLAQAQRKVTAERKGEPATPPAHHTCDDDECDACDDDFNKHGRPIQPATPPGETWVCPKCGEVYHSEIHAKNHAWKAHGIGTGATPPARPIDKRSPADFGCQHSAQDWYLTPAGCYCRECDGPPCPEPDCCGEPATPPGEAARGIPGLPLIPVNVPPPKGVKSPAPSATAAPPADLPVGWLGATLDEAAKAEAQLPEWAKGSFGTAAPPAGAEGEGEVLWEGRLPGGEGPDGWWTDERRVMADGTVMFHFPSVTPPRWSHMQLVLHEHKCRVRAHLATALAAETAKRKKVERLHDQACLYAAHMAATAKQAEARTTAAEDDARRWSLALQSLTPQGSEYAGDPGRCVDFVRWHREDMHERVVRFKRQRDEEREKLTAAEQARDAAQGERGTLLAAVDAHTTELNAAWEQTNPANAAAQILIANERLYAVADAVRENTPPRISMEPPGYNMHLHPQFQAFIAEKKAAAPPGCTCWDTDNTAPCLAHNKGESK